MTIVTITDDTFDAPSNGLITTSCAGCGITIPHGRKWCSEQCRNRHRQRDNPRLEEDPPLTADVWTFGQVVSELVGCGLVVDLEIEGIALRLSRHEP